MGPPSRVTPWVSKGGVSLGLPKPKSRGSLNRHRQLKWAFWLVPQRAMLFSAWSWKEEEICGAKFEWT